MRSDMKEVIIDRPRGGSRMNGYKSVRRSKLGQDLPNKVSMTKMYGFDRKSQSDVLGPLRKYLKAHIGELWNDVWSDICKVNDKRSLIGSHLRDHIGYLVEQELEFNEQGKLCHKTGHGSWRGVRFSGGFYVHPDKGTLCYMNKDYPEFYNPPRIQMDKLVNISGLRFWKYEDVWYEVSFAPIPKPTIRNQNLPFYINDALYGRQSFENWTQMMYWSMGKYSSFEIFCYKKVPATKKMIKKIEKAIATK